MAGRDGGRLFNFEERLMILLGLRILEELDRVLSEPPDEKVLEIMGSPCELYAEDWKQDRADEAEIEQHKMETGQSEGTEALFATKDGKISVLWISTPPPARFRGFEHFSRLVVLPEPSDLDAYGIAWSAFARRGIRVSLRCSRRRIDISPKRGCESGFCCGLAVIKSII